MVLQRMVEIARALATGPSILLLDEPAAGVNPSEIDRLSTVIRRVAASGVTMLVIEHHMDLVMGVSNHVTVLDYGKKIAEALRECPVEPTRNRGVPWQRGALLRGSATRGQESGVSVT